MSFRKMASQCEINCVVCGQSKKGESLSVLYEKGAASLNEAIALRRDVLSNVKCGDMRTNLAERIT